MNIEEFADRFRTVQEGVLRDHEDDATICHVMHREIGLDDGPPADNAEFYSAMTGVPVDNIGLSQGHFALHEFLEAVVAESERIGSGIEELICAMFVIGRRIGLADAADMGVNVPDTLPE